MSGAWLRRTLPTHQHRIAALLLFAFLVVGSIVGLGVFVGSRAALAAVGVWGLVIAGLRELFALWRPFRALPELEVALHHEGTTKTELILERTQAVRPIDRRAIVSEQGDVARETVEPRPPPEPRSLFTPVNYDFRESYDDALARFRSELEEFSRQLGAWLVTYESHRWPTASYVEAWLRIENRGGAPAEDLSVELELPEALMRISERPAIDAPPGPPVFERRYVVKSLGAPNPPIVRTGEGIEPGLGNIAGPDWVTEEGVRIARYRAQKLLQGTRDFSAHPLRLVATEVGRYEVRWIARATNIDEPMRGRFVVDARPQPRADEPLRTLSAVIEPGDVEIRRRYAPRSG